MAARKLTVYSEARQELAAFEKKYNSLVVDCSTIEGMKSAKDSRKEIRDARSNLEDLRKETKAPHLDKGKQIDSEAKVVEEALTKLFQKFDGAIKAIENKAAIDAQKKLEDAAAKIKDLEAREQAIYDKEIELGIREAPVQVDSDDEDATPDNSDSDSSVSSDTSSVESADIETICEPHIKVAATRLKALKAIRKLVEATDPQPEGEIDEDIAAAHDKVLEELWEIVDIFK